jgi:hypothetical protein
MPIMYDILVICGIIQFIIYFDKFFNFVFKQLMLNMCILKTELSWWMGVFIWLTFGSKIGFLIFNNLFLKLVFYMSCIIISCKITTLSKECKCDNVTWMLSIFNCTCLVVDKGLLSSDQMFVLGISSQLNRMMGPMVLDIY